MKQGDILVSVNGQPLRSDSRLHEVIRETNGAPIDLVYSRDGQQHSVMITPAKRDVNGQERWMIGVALQQHVDIAKLPFGAALRNPSAKTCRARS